MISDSSLLATAEFDYIVVGSGAGGGPLAARLALKGSRVLVIEAGSDFSTRPPTDHAREISEVPSFHGPTSEDPDHSWQFFVKHYSNPPPNPDPTKPSDSKDPTGRGVFYPRAAALGGCTIHNAMITIAGPDSDWDDLADFLADDSWRAEVMRPYFQRLERNEYVDRPAAPPTGWWPRLQDNIRWLFGRGRDYTAGRHGFDGWLRTSVADITLGVHDGQLLKMIKSALRQAERVGIDRYFTFARHFLRGRIKQSLDPNHARTQAESPEGLALIPLAVCGKNGTSLEHGTPSLAKRGHRSSPREFLLETQAELKAEAATHRTAGRIEAAASVGEIVIWTECFVTQVLFEDVAAAVPPASPKKPRAIGVEILRGRQIYGAHPHPLPPPTALREKIYLKGGEANGGEIILSGGAFNTPQILMLSGIGDAEKLKPHKIDCRVHLPGVGLNLHDRYEVTVLSEMEGNFSLLEGADFALPKPPAGPDPFLTQWRDQGTGLYASNGSVIGILKRSAPDLPQPDLFIFGIPLPFKGYQPGYSNVQSLYPKDFRRLFTWAILKAQTRNRDGTVELRSANPLDPPEINFHYFQETSHPGKENDDPDLDALVDGVRFVRGIAKYAHLVVKGEASPGLREVPENDEPMLRDWIRREAWGHHACGSCRMGPDDDGNAVLDSRFRVRGVDGLRVVDASIFPKIPGYFIVTNIYVSSEKAADVILQDAVSERAKSTPRDTAVYPRDLRAAEAAAIDLRRDELIPKSKRTRTEAKNSAIANAGEWPDDLAGFGISGGGVRSATLNIGVLQAMARAKWLRKIDFLSTVSGGGYVGAFVGRFYDRMRHTALSGGTRHTHLPAADRVEHELNASDSKEIEWLRKSGNYIAPSGSGDAHFNLAVFLRNLLSVHFVVGVLIFAMFGLANAVRYGVFDKGITVVGFALPGKADLPVGHLLHAALGVFWSPWFILFELVLLFLVVPRIVGYWLASQDEHERYHWPSLALVFIAVIVLLYVGVKDGIAIGPLAIALSLLSSFVFVEMAWWRGRSREEAAGTGGPETQRVRTRTYLTYDLGLALIVAAASLAFALIDTAGHGLYEWLAQNQSYTIAFAKLGGILAALIPIARGAANILASKSKPKTFTPPSTLSRIFSKELAAGMIAIVLLTVPLVFYSFTSHAVFQGGSAFVVGLAATALAIVISGILATPSALAFVNRSSLAQTYSGRLARAYLGASNPLRHHPNGANINEVISGDDVNSIRDYRPYEAGGPLHLINVTVNQTVDFTSQRGNRDRKGENMAVSSLGVSVGEKWHSRWAQRFGAGQSDPRCDRRARLEAVGHMPGSDHPLLDETRQPTNDAETLSLRQWIGISGAAVGPGQGQTTQLSTSLLFGLANLRTGYWWDSGINEAARQGFPEMTFFRRLLYLLPWMFTPQALLISEWIARYPGPWEQFWYISDGGFFENLATYELIRRRVPRIIVTDGGADPSYQFEDLANLTRKARIDFDACIEPFDSEDIKRLPKTVQDLVGTKLGDLKAIIGEDGTIATPPLKHAMLFWVKYQTAPHRRSVLLYLKATVTGDETTDILQYQASNPEFPHEATGDQFFDEAQWESYRQLGEHMASALFEADPLWFWKIELPSD